jgi:hypothetical protein
MSILSSKQAAGRAHIIGYAATISTVNLQHSKNEIQSSTVSSSPLQRIPIKPLSDPAYSLTQLCSTNQEDVVDWRFQQFRPRDYWGMLMTPPVVPTFTVVVMLWTPPMLRQTEWSSLTPVIYMPRS